MAKSERDVRVIVDGVEMSMSEALRQNGEPDIRIRTIPEGESRTVNGRRYTVIGCGGRCGEDICECERCERCGSYDVEEHEPYAFCGDCVEEHAAEVRRGAA